MAQGGKREGSGRKKGSLASHTLDAQSKKQRIVQRVNDATDVLIDAQLSIARGASFLYKIHTNSKGIKEKPELITDTYTIEAYLNGDLENNDEDDWYYITTDKPNNQAIDSLFDRVHGKSAQSITGADGKELVIRITGETAERYGLLKEDKE